MSSPAGDFQSRAVGAARTDWAELVATHDAPLKRMCFMVTGDTETAQDAVQATWERAYRKWTQLRTPSKVRAWLSAIAMNEARAALRSQGRNAQVLEWEPRPARDLDLANALALLPVQDRQLLALTVVEGFTSSEAGKVLGLSAEGVRTRKARIVARLRKELS
jgi:RNA polymerase sigma-70 factor (ECF subfamily)